MRRAEAMDEAQNLRKLATWYRQYADRAANLWIWEARLKRADEAEALQHTADDGSRRGNSLNLHRHRDPAIYPHV
jgi:hypothetical protein